MAIPDHLSDAPVPQDFASGYWCTDFNFEYEGPGPRFRDHNRWMLPRRWRMAGAFKVSLVDEPRHTRHLLSGVPRILRARFQYQF
jgi:hypothetical protein